jgi:hypothetical protein
MHVRLFCLLMLALPSFAATALSPAVHLAVLRLLNSDAILSRQLS